MAAAKLAKFTISPAGEDYRLHVEDDKGTVLDLVATRDQIDIIDDALEDLLDRDGGEADEVKA